MPHKTSLFTKWERQGLFRPRSSTYGVQTVLSEHAHMHSLVLSLHQHNEVSITPF